EEIAFGSSPNRPETSSDSLCGEALPAPCAVACRPNEPGAPRRAPERAQARHCVILFIIVHFTGQREQTHSRNFENKNTSVIPVFRFRARAGGRDAPSGPGKAAHAPGLRGWRARGALRSASTTPPAPAHGRPPGQAMFGVVPHRSLCRSKGTNPFPKFRT